MVLTQLHHSLGFGSPFGAGGVEQCSEGARGGPLEVLEYIGRRSCTIDREDDVVKQ